jgi:hypothetical protein
MILTAESIPQIDDQLAHYQRVLLSLPRSHPSHPSLIKLLAALHANRYQISRQKEDLDGLILRRTQEIFVAPPWDKNIVYIFFYLLSALRLRAIDFQQSNIAPYCAKCFRYLLSLPLKTVDVPRNDVKEYLILIRGTLYSGEPGHRQCSWEH